MPGYKEHFILNILLENVENFPFSPREWISPATVTFILRELVTNPAYSHLVDMFHWIIIPVLNPDGYVYTHTKVLQ